MEARDPLLDDYVLDLARARRERPRVCFLPTASGDADHYVVRFYGPSRTAATRRTSRCSDRAIAATRDPVAHLLEQDLIYVGGGSVISMLGTWRAHGLDDAPARARGSPASSCAG